MEKITIDKEVLVDLSKIAEKLGSIISSIKKQYLNESDLLADYIVPHSRGGKTTVENGQVLCGKCNLSKGAK